MRRRRIANGSGTSIQDVNKLIKQFDEMRKMMRGFNKNKMRNIMKGLNISPNMLDRMKTN